jgi:hypothetical protein
MNESAAPARESETPLADILPFLRGARWEDVDLSLQTGGGDASGLSRRRCALTLVRDLDPGRRDRRYLRP